MGCFFNPLSLPLALGKDIDNQSSYTLFVCFLETGSYASLELIMCQSALFWVPLSTHGYLPPFLLTPGLSSLPLAPGLCMLNYEKPAGLTTQSARLGKYQSTPSICGEERACLGLLAWSQVSGGCLGCMWTEHLAAVSTGPRHLEGISLRAGYLQGLFFFPKAREIPMIISSPFFPLPKGLLR